MNERYEPTIESLKQHEIPEWYQDAKLGIFIHWGLYSVPAFAPTQYGDITQTVGDHGFEFHFTHNPYAEWYLNSLRTKGEDYIQYHTAKYGEDFPYHQFKEEFNEQIKAWKPEEWASYFYKIGAKYVVLTTKHHDGFLLWPSETSNPHPPTPNYHASRNIVGELTQAVRNAGLKMGLYYSGGLDWTFCLEAIKETTTLLSNAPSTEEYGVYVDKHYRELIDKFQPSVLWNDIAYPIKGGLLDVIAHYHNSVPEGVVNDRWSQIPKIARILHRTFIIRKLIGYIAAKVVKNGGFEGKPPKGIADYSTPEYEPNTDLRSYKWESCRGIGRSFGYNQMETPEHYLTSEDLIRSFVDIVSKNGNLLLNIGPKANGEIPELQKERLDALGKWLGKYGEGIFATRPWDIAEITSKEGYKIRFTQNKEHTKIFVFCLDNLAQNKTLTIPTKFPAISQISELSTKADVEWEQAGDSVKIVFGESDTDPFVSAIEISLIQ